MIDQDNSNHNNKSIAKNAIFNVLYKIMNMFFPLITTIYISHILMASGVGKVSTAQNIAQYFVLLAPMGIANYGIREIARSRNDHVNMERLFTELFSINFCSSLLCAGIYYCIILKGEYFAAERILYLVVGLPIVFNLINIEWFYQGNEEYVYIAIRSVIVKFVSLLAIVFCVKAVEDYVVYALIYALGMAGNYLFNIINLVKKGVHLNFSNLSISRHFKPIFILLCSNIAIELYTLLDTTMLGVMCTDETVGYYTNSIKLVKIIVSLITAIGGVILPRLSYYKKQGMIQECNLLISKMTKVMLFFAIPSGLGVFLLADKLVWIMFGETFMPSVFTVRVATILIYVLGFSNLFGTQVLLTFNQEKKLLICTCVGAVSNIIMNSFLIPMFEHNGAVIASVISETIVTLMTLSFAKKHAAIKIEPNYWMKIMVASVGMSGMVLFLTQAISNALCCAISCVFCGGILYLVLGILLKNELLIELKTIVVNKFRGGQNV